MTKKSVLKIAQSQKYNDPDWWSWSVWVDGAETDLKEIQKVEYTLHPTFRNPVRTVTNRRNKFKLSTEGWGGFPIYVQLFRKDGKVVRLKHELELFYPDGKATTA